MAKKSFDYDELKNQLESVWDKTLVTLDKGKKEVIRLSKMGKIKLDAQMMARDKNYLFQKLGEETYKGLKNNSLNTSSLNRWVDKIDKLDKQIKACDSKLGELAKTKPSRKRSSKKKS